MNLKKKTQIKIKMDANEKDEYGYTLLSNAVISNDVELVKELLEYDNIDVNKKDDGGDTPFIWAMMFEYIEIAELLLKHGANVNAKNKNGETALMHASGYVGDKKIIEMLLNANAKVDEKDKNGETALMWASRYAGDKKIIKMLIDKGASTENAYRMVIDDDDDETAEFIEKCVEADWVKNENEEWFNAIRHGNIERVQEFLNRDGMNVNTRFDDDEGSVTSLMFAVIHNNTKIVELLLKHGANVNRQDEDERTALSFAACRNNAYIVKLLLDNGATKTIDLMDSERYSPLLSASALGCVESAKVLLEYGSNINPKYGYGTGLTIAASNNKIGIVELFLEKGANIDETDVHGWTPLMCASFHRHTKIVELLLKKGAEIDVKCNDGYGTALMCASRWGHTKIVKLLLKYGANVDIKNNKGRTAYDLTDNEKIKELLKRDKTL